MLIISFETVLATGCAERFLLSGSWLSRWQMRKIFRFRACQSSEAVELSRNLIHDVGIDGIKTDPSQQVTQNRNVHVIYLTYVYKYIYLQFPYLSPSSHSCNGHVSRIGAYSFKLLHPRDPEDHINTRILAVWYGIT